MLSLRWMCVLTGAWWIALCGSVLLLEPLGVTRALWAIPSLAALVLLAWPGAAAHRRAVWLGSIALLLAAKAALGHDLVGRDLQPTLIEALAIGITLWLAGRLADALGQLTEAAAKLALLDGGAIATPFDEIQPQILQEIRRARRYERPAALIAVSLDRTELESQRERLLQEIGRAQIHGYATARLGDILHRETASYAVVSRRGSHFLTLLPETDARDAARLLERIAHLAERELGLKLRAGASSFPEEEVTLSRLIERAEARMAPGGEEAFAENGIAPALEGDPVLARAR